MRPGTFDLYLAKRWSGLFSVVLLGFTALAMLIDVTLRYENLREQHDLVAKALKFYVGVSPLFLHAIAPIVGFATSVILMTISASRREWLTLQGAGRSPARLVLPFVVLGVLLAGASGVNRELLVPRAIDAYFSLRGREQSTGGVTRQKGQLLSYGRSSLAEDAVYDVVYVEHDGKTIASLSSAKQLSWRDGTVTARQDCKSVRHAGGIFRREGAQDWAVVPPPGVAVQEMFPVPLRFFEKSALARDSRWWLCWHELWTLPLSTIVLQLLAGAFLLNDQARSLPGRVAGALLAGFLFCYLTVWCRQLGLQGVLPAAAAAWSPLSIAIATTAVLWRRAALHFLPEATS
jgi:lipopolysaccharide export LptBFGC system permease protein LptF